MWKKYLLLYAVTIPIGVMAAACRTFNLDPISLLCSFTIITVYTAIALSKFKSLRSLYAFLTILAGVFTLEFLPRTIGSDIRTMYSSVGIVIGCCFGYVIFLAKGKTKKTISILCAALFIALYTTVGYRYWKNWLHDVQAKEFHFYDTVESID